MKAGSAPATNIDKGRAEAARRFENQDYRAVQLPLMEQLTLHPRPEQGSWTSCVRIGAATAAGFTEAHVVEAEEGFCALAIKP
jgi:hypothetical protein